MVLANPINFFSFDFAGCGKSEGVYSSVGWFEQEDLECVVEYLRNTNKITKIALWGRSMGAITSIFYTHRDPNISAIILDSAFSDFEKFVKEIAKNKASIPGFLTGGILSLLSRTVKKKANFDIEDLKPIEYVPKIKVPALYGAASGDSFVSPLHSRDLFKAHAGYK